MTPFEKLAAAANRLIQIGNHARNSETRIELAEIAATVRCASASILRAIEGEAQKSPRPAKFSGVVGDETELPPPRAARTRKVAAKKPKETQAA
jgi:hypothetical protein